MNVYNLHSCCLKERSSTDPTKSYIKDADIIKQRAYQTIAQLRTLLKELDINIVSVRGTGYQLQFAGSTEAEGEG